MINKLTQEQEKLKETIKKEWIDFCLSGDSSLDYDKAEKGISFIYDKIKKPKPLLLISDSPWSAILISKLFGSTSKNTDYFGCGLDAGWVSFYDYFTKAGIINHAEFNEINSFLKSGVWDMLLFEKLAILIRRPISVIKNNQGQLHNEKGMAVEFKDKMGIYALNGVRMSKVQVMTPSEKMDIQLIVKEKNVEVRRELIRKIGIERFIQKAGAKVLDKQGDYEVLSIHLSKEVPDARYLKMFNPSIGVWHVEGVEKECDTVEKALNWRAGNINEKWEPAILT